jgi:outer membrane protein OmpA-like peptidoglycan-associated protein
MKKTSILLMALLVVPFYFTSCKSLTKTQKGAAVGTVAGGTAGAVIGRATGNPAMGTVIGAVVGGVTGAVIGKKMDKQAQEIEAEVPGVTVERVGEGIVVEFASQILFGFDNSALTPDAKNGLSKLVTILNKYPDTDIEIHGHTDSKGTAKYNQALSVRRANEVSSFLTNNQIKPNRIVIVGNGENKPKYTNETDEGRSKNRRVEFAISANEKMKADAKAEADKG